MLTNRNAFAATAMLIAIGFVSVASAQTAAQNLEFQKCVLGKIDPVRGNQDMTMEIKKICASILAHDITAQTAAALSNGASLSRDRYNNYSISFTNNTAYHVWRLCVNFNPGQNIRCGQRDPSYTGVTVEPFSTGDLSVDAPANYQGLNWSIVSVQGF